MKTSLKHLVAAALVAGAGALTADAALSHSAAVVDTRANVLAEILPASCTYEYSDNAVLTVKFTVSPSSTQFALPDNMGPIAFDLNGQTLADATGTEGGSSGGDGAWAFRVGSSTTIIALDSAGSGGLIDARFAPTTSTDNGRRVSCTGWILYTSASVDADEWAEWMRGDGDECRFTLSEGTVAKLEWQVVIEYLVEVSAVGNGNVSVDGGASASTASVWVTADSVHTVTATANEGATFAYWMGDVAAADDTSANFAVMVDGPVACEATFLNGQVCSWKGGNASVPANWRDGVLPGDGATIVVGGSASDMTWDLADVTPGQWVQLAGCMGAVTFATTYPDGALPEVVIDGNVELLGGRWTHRANGETEAYRLAVRVNGDLTVGEDGAIDAVGKGLLAVGASSLHPSLLQPMGCGTATAGSAGGGAIALTVAGKLTVAGAIDASGAPTLNQATGSGGSVWIQANAIEASGRIAAEGGGFIAAGTPGGAGGRVAVVLTGAGSDFSNVAAGVLSATAGRGNTGVASDASPCGTVYCKTAARARGLLIVDNAVGSDKAVPTVFDTAQTKELSQAVFTLRSNAQIKISGELSVGDLVFVETTAKLDLDGNVLKVKTPWHAYPQSQVVNAGEWVSTGKRPGYVNIQWSIPGLVVFIQ